MKLHNNTSLIFLIEFAIMLWFSVQYLVHNNTSLIFLTGYVFSTIFSSKVNGHNNVVNQVASLESSLSVWWIMLF